MPVSVAVDYYCPLCPNHRDDEFFYVPGIETPICQGCSVELTAFGEEDNRPDDEIIERVEALTGREWSEYKELLLDALRQFDST